MSSSAMHQSVPETSSETPTTQWVPINTPRQEISEEDLHMLDEENSSQYEWSDLEEEPEDADGDEL